MEFLEFFRLFCFGMEGKSLVSELGLSFLCKILVPASAVSNSVFSMEIRPEVMRGGLLLLFNLRSWSELLRGGGSGGSIDDLLSSIQPSKVDS